MQLFLGGLIGAAVGAVYATLAFCLLAKDISAFGFGLFMVAPLGVVIGCPLGIMSARRIRWGQRHTRIIGRSAVALAVPAAVASLIYWVREALREGYGGFWDNGGGGAVMNIEALIIFMMTLAAAVVGGTVGAVAGAVLSLFKMSRVSAPEVERPQEQQDWEEAWPPAPDRSSENK